MKGLALISTLIEATNLPKSSLQNDIEKYASENSYELENLSLDQLRDLMASYLQDIMLDLKKSMES